VGNFLAGLKVLWKSLYKKILESRNLCGTFIMNERINELLKQSRTEYWTQYTPSYDYEKFAELIVKECAKIVNENDCEGSTVGDGMLFEHFGVEE
jgi:hypothetical protein